MAHEKCHRLLKETRIDHVASVSPIGYLSCGGLGIEVEVPIIDETDQSPSLTEGRRVLLPKFCAHGNDGPGIFELFLTTRGGGKSTRIGLDVSPTIVVEQHGGDIRFTSEPGANRFQLRPPMDGSDGEASRNVVQSLDVGQ